MSGDQALNVLSQIQACTYERPDLQERRLGLIADEVEDAIEQLAIDNVVGSKLHEGVDHKTLDYSRLVVLCISSINRVSQQGEELESKVDGAA